MLTFLTIFSIQFLPLSSVCISIAVHTTKNSADNLSFAIGTTQNQWKLRVYIEISVHMCDTPNCFGLIKTGESYIG